MDEKEHSANASQFLEVTIMLGWFYAFDFIGSPIGGPYS
jgi:hypothetical protein